MNNVDFLPERIRQQQSRRRRLVIQAYLVGACVLALVFLGYMREQSIKKAHGELTMLRERESNVERQLSMRDTLQQEQAQLLIKKRIDDRLGSRTGALDILAELERLMPPSMALTGLTFEAVEVRQGLAKPGSPPQAGDDAGRQGVNRVRVAITGLAPSDVDVASFIGQLSASPLCEDVNMGYARNTVFRGRAAREFQASCYLAR
jgi:Tfp pilus assembly protein PilN